REPVSGQRRYTVGRETPARRATSVNVVRRTPNSATQSRAASKIAVSIGEEAAGASGRVGAAEVADAPDGTAADVRDPPGSAGASGRASGMCSPPMIVCVPTVRRPSLRLLLDILCKTVTHG